MENINSKKLKKGFTLIELIVVMAILAVLVLLAAPKLLGYSEKARTTQIRNDIKVLETKIDEYLINHERFPDTFIDGVVGEGQLYNRTGKIEAAPDNLKVVDRTFYPETELPGTFYTDPDGDVIYENDNNSVVGVGPNLSDSEISDLVDVGYIPVASGDELNQIARNGEILTFGEGTVWEGQYKSGLNAKYIQVQDIDLSSFSNWNPIGGIPGNYGNYFFGIYNGGYFTIRNLTINDVSGNDSALFYGNSGTIENLNISNFNVAGTEFAAGLVANLDQENPNRTVILRNIEAMDLNITSSGNASGGLVAHAYMAVMDNMKAQGTVSGYGNDGVGGIVGFNDASTVINSNFEGEVTGDWAVGGIAGFNFESSISNSKFFGNINPISSSPDGAFGGIAGYNDGSTIENSQVIGTIRGGYVGVGGIAGYHENNGFENDKIGVINHCSVIGDVINTPIPGEDWAPTGGIAGNSYGAIIANSYIVGDVEGYNYVGGIAGDGDTSHIYNTFIIGDVVALATDGDFYNGGIVGFSSIKYNGDRRKIEDSFIVGKIVSDSPEPRGVAGVTYSGTLVNGRVTYTDIISSEGFTNVNQYDDIDALKADSNAFNNWDLEGVWVLDSSKSSYPVLRETPKVNYENIKR